MKDCNCSDCEWYYRDSFGYFGVCTGITPTSIKHDCIAHSQLYNTTTLKKVREEVHEKSNQLSLKQHNS